jgi:hypothetical protein
MIKDLFPTKILQRDLTISDQDDLAICSFINALHIDIKSKSNFDVACEELHLFSEENKKVCPELNIIQQAFVQGFKDLLDANGLDPEYYGHELIKNKIESVITSDGRPWVKLPFMRAESKEFKRSHVHEQSCVWGILYLQDVDHEKYGGQLYLEDPKHVIQSHFNVDSDIKIEAKRHRLVIVPNYVWHGVTPYNGPDDRLSIVVSLPNSILE